MYLLGCLLTFYQQLRIWRDGGAQWRAFHPAKPLWVFLGKTVTGSSKADRATRSDVVRILRFLGWGAGPRRRGAAHDRATARRAVGAARRRGPGLLRRRFLPLAAHRGKTRPNRSTPTSARPCSTAREGCTWSTSPPAKASCTFAPPTTIPSGVVNVGDSAALYKLLTENPDPDPDFDVDRGDGLRGAAVRGVDRPDSTVNVVIGARRFIAGWNSWAREHDGADARRGRRRAGDHPDVRARGAPEGLEHELEAPPRERCGATAGRRPADGAGEALHLRAARQLHADLPGPAATGRGGRGAGDVLPADHLELRKEDRPQADPAQGRPQVRALRRTPGSAGSGPGCRGRPPPGEPGSLPRGCNRWRPPAPRRARRRRAARRATRLEGTPRPLTDPKAYPAGAGFARPRLGPSVSTPTPAPTKPRSVAIVSGEERKEEAGSAPGSVQAREPCRLPRRGPPPRTAAAPQAATGLA